MILSKLDTFAERTAFFGTATTVKIGEAMDLGTAPTDIGEGIPMFFNALITTSMAGGTSMQLQLVTADNADLTTNPEVVLLTRVVPVAEALAGTPLIVVALPKTDYRRYLGVRVVRVGTSTAGAVSAFLALDPPNWRAYPEGLN